MEAKPVEIRSQDFWFKIIEMLQQNWALVDETDTGATVWFIGDTSGVFDMIEFSSRPEAVAALRRNGFERYAEDPSAQGFIVPPDPPFHEAPHPNGPIASSGRFWT